MERPANASRLLVILPIICLITLTSDLTSSKRCPLGGGALPFPFRRRRRRDWGVFGPIWGVQNGYCVWGKRGEAGTVGSVVASHRLQMFHVQFMCKGSLCAPPKRQFNLMWIKTHFLLLEQY